MDDTEQLEDLIRRAADALNCAEATAYLAFEDDDLEVLLSMVRLSTRN